jgi:hypothetical protein
MYTYAKEDRLLVHILLQLINFPIALPVILYEPFFCGNGLVNFSVSGVENAIHSPVPLLGVGFKAEFFEFFE